MRTLRIKLTSLDVAIMCLQIVEFYFIPHKIFVLFKYITCLYLLAKYSSAMKRRIYLFGLLGSYAMILTVSTVVNTNSLPWALSAFVEGIQLIILFVVSEGVTRKEGFYNYAWCLLRFFFFLLLVNDLLFLVFPYDFSNPDEYYLVGNKFWVSYFHILTGCLYYSVASNKKQKVTSIGIIVYAGIIARVVTCTTGVIMALAVLMMILLPKMIRKIIATPLMLLLTIGVENILIWGSTNIFSHPMVQSIIVNLFQKSPNLTGRTKLYNVTFSLVSQKPLLGYGYKTNVYRDLFGYGNAQNGLFHIITQAGILGALVYFAVVYVAAKKDRYSDTYYGIIMYLYAMIVAAAIEISLSLLFMFGVAILYAYNMQYKKSHYKLFRSGAILNENKRNE